MKEFYSDSLHQLFLGEKVMNYEIIKPGEGIEYEWSSDHIFVKSVGNLNEKHDIWNE